ncbi:response regulator [Microvirga lotononidis]|uniref:CheY-like receiver domain-containing protein n=1 Tax=Microvirga lotononidis TaxID=864069 RepID=I4YSA5_9HYPH|nr:response regulator [Microvirga lotononidis]EIM26847.1 CheY-like receiver domain-containing protein [Microvirga lotononidis]WQO31403.1 response regulator [Microvirga lotononidis]
MSPASTHLTPRSDAPPQTVLVVEDEVLVRLVIADYLRECGYRVYEAANAGEAVAVLQSPEASIDVVFSDAQMPGDMDGFGLARWVRANKPGIQVILTSGVERAADVAATLCEAGPLLKKPYPSQEAVNHIKQLQAKAGRA